MENKKLQFGSSPVSQQESKTLKARVRLLYDSKEFIISLIIIFFTILTSVLIWTLSPEGSFLIIFSGLIWFLLPLSSLFINRSNPITVTSRKIIIKRPILKSVTIEKEDIMQISGKKNGDHSLRWLFRLIYVIFITFLFVQGIMEGLQDLKRTSPYYVVVSLLLQRLAIVAFFIVLFYDFELIASYQRILKVTTRSNLKLQFFTNDPQELTRILEKEI